jgi:probable addiction module antidote protein
MAKTKTRPWDVAEHLETEADMAAYLEAVLEDGDPALVAAALGDIARAKGMSAIARKTGMGARACTRRCRPRATRNLRPCSRLCERWGSSYMPPPRMAAFARLAVVVGRRDHCGAADFNPTVIPSTIFRITPLTR